MTPNSPPARSCAWNTARLAGCAPRCAHGPASRDRREARLSVATRRSALSASGDSDPCGSAASADRAVGAPSAWTAWRPSASIPCGRVSSEPFQWNGIVRPRAMTREERSSTRRIWKSAKRGTSTPKYAGVWFPCWLYSGHTCRKSSWDRTCSHRSGRSAAVWKLNHCGQPDGGSMPQDDSEINRFDFERSSIVADQGHVPPACHNSWHETDIRGHPAASASNHSRTLPGRWWRRGESNP
jgi:hypothetical protein